jgi:hypothetical protein
VLGVVVAHDAVRGGINIASYAVLRTSRRQSREIPRSNVEP